jgi:hypothetical protein
MLVDPMVVNLPATSGRVLVDARGRDVRLVWPTMRRGAARVRNWRNLMSIGGHADVGNTTAPNGDGDRRVLELAGGSGIAHIEGLLLTHSNGLEGDAFYITNCVGAIVQIANCEAPNVRGSKAGDHGDIVQLYQAGLARLDVDGLKASTSYQGFGDFDNPRSLMWRLRRVRLGWDQAAHVEGGGQLIWPGVGAKVALVDVKATGTRAGLSATQVLYPGGFFSEGGLTSPQATGSVIIDPGCMSDDLGYTPGLSYTSPGYA